jgi:cellulose biosynthesis protein BcsQ
VGKTTLTFNIAAALATLGRRVLLVDADPQCNLTAYLIEGSVVDDLLENSDDEDGQTIWSALKPIVEASGSLGQIESIELSSKLQILPGDIRLSDFEEELNDFWRQCLQRKKRGFSGTTALSRLVDATCIEHKIDFVFYDSGPNIGPLNRVILLDCDYFVIPAAYDLFSVRALKTLGRTIVSWIEEWQTIADLAPEDSYSLAGCPQFLGYIPQNFSVYRGGVASHQAKYQTMLEKGIQADIVGVFRAAGLPTQGGPYKLGEVKDFGSLIAASQREGVPISEVHAGTPAQRSAARTTFRAIAERIVQRAVDHDG